MSGYLGNPDAEAEHALILSENGVHASRLLLEGPILTDCDDCGNEINPLRVAAAEKMGMKCMYCIVCQPKYDKPGRIRMLDRIL